MLNFTKEQLYNLSDKSISFETFSDSLDRVKELCTELKKFNSKEEAIQFLMEETKEVYEKCVEAYDFYSKLANKL
ncbi:MAG: hypothetical protein IKY26_01730 [Erysipelotrichaceae bacterium]|nr:hypothetical protein [Erysipelotrichaceae bacterium]